ncbi:MAG: hypothetical protein KJ888_21065 [Gammaproteobacteria bacterium]|nr:hypothetical protein [Gammaproteobacteria bacterium]
MKPPPGGHGEENADLHFSLMRLSEIRGWESHEAWMNDVIDALQPTSGDDIQEEDFQEPE